MSTPERLPGGGWLRIAKRWFEPDTIARVIEPMVADWQREYLDAAPVHRRWIAARGHAALLTTVLLTVPQLLIAPLPASLTIRMWFRVFMFCLVVIVIQSGVYFLQPRPMPAIGWFYLVPAMLTFALPFAMGPAVDAIRCSDAVTPHVARRAVVRLVAVGVLWMVVGAGWIAPQANRRWGQMVDSANAKHSVEALLTVRDLSTYDLVVAKGGTYPAIRTADLQRELNTRGSLALLPVLLAWIRWRTLELPRERWFSPLPATVIAAMGASAIILLQAIYGMLGDRLWHGQQLGLWIAMILFPVSHAFVTTWSRRSSRAVHRS